MALVEKKKIHEAVDMLRAGSFKTKRDAWLWAYLALHVWTENKNLEEVQSLLDMAINLNDDAGRFSYFQGTIFKQDSRHKEAIAAFETALDRGQDTEPKVWLALGDSCVETSDLGRAETAYRTALSLEPKLASAWFSLGELLVDHNLNLPEGDEPNNLLNLPECS